jgi:hypothetical protein
MKRWVVAMSTCWLAVCASCTGRPSGAGADAGDSAHRDASAADSDGGLTRTEAGEVLRPAGFRALPDGGCEAFHSDPDNPPPWANCSMRLETYEIPPRHPVGACGPGRLLVQTGISSHAGSSIGRDSLVTQDGTIRLSDGQLDVYRGTGPGSYDMKLRDMGTHWLALVGWASPGRVNLGRALLRFDSLDGEGRLLHALDFPSNSVGRAPGVSHFVATPSFTSWMGIDPDGPARLYVAGPNGEQPTELLSPPNRGDFYAQGDRMVFAAGGGVYLYDHRDRSLRAMTSPDPRDLRERAPWLDGDNLVFLEGEGDPALLAEAQLAHIDLRTGVRTTLTDVHSDDTVFQVRDAWVSGEWVIWTQHAGRAVSPEGQRGWQYQALHGYNLRTRRRYPIITGELVIGSSWRAGDKLVYQCVTRSWELGPIAVSALYIMDMPTP